MAGSKFSTAVVGMNEIEREGLTRVLRDRGVDVLGHYGRYQDLLPELLSTDAKLLIMLNALGDEASLAAVKAIRLASSTCRILVLEHNCDSPTVARSFAAGTDAYVAKDTSCASLVTMLELVSLGEKVLPSQIIADLPLAKGEAEGEVPADFGTSNLSDREIAIMRGLIRGEPNKIISRRLVITEATVKVHVKSILRKIGAKNRTQAAIWGVASGLNTLATGETSARYHNAEARAPRDGDMLAAAAA